MDLISKAQSFGAIRIVIDDQKPMLLDSSFAVLAGARCNARERADDARPCARCGPRPHGSAYDRSC